MDELSGAGLERRGIVKALGTLPLAAILADAGAVQAAAAGTMSVTLTTPGGRAVTGALALPASTPAAAVLLVHEWWGLNDQIKAVAADLAAAGYIALAVDLFDGRVAANPDEARALVTGVDPVAAADILTAWIDWLRSRPDGNGRVATLGWCFGGGWSLQASLLRPVEATVIYYGRVTDPAERLKALKGPVLGHFARRDQHIPPEMVAGFESEMAKAGKPLELHTYDADHAFANPTGNNYHRDDAQLAWTRTLAFLNANLR